MKVALYDLDSKIANLALMKISKYHKDQGDQVKWFMPLDADYDTCYISKIFDFSPMPEFEPANAVWGGTGYSVTSQLPDDMDACQPDYDVYPDINYSIQLFSRGCPRKCKFCVVPKKEGNIHSVEPMDLNPRGEMIMILDNNFFANEYYRYNICYLKHVSQPIDFIQGIDIRIMNEEQCHYLWVLKSTCGIMGPSKSIWNKGKDKLVPKRIRFAWDNYKDKLEKKIEMLIQYIHPHDLMCYVLIGFDSTEEEDLYRVEKLREYGVSPYIMPFNTKDPYQKRFSRWVNHKAIFKSVAWKDYKG